jgi:folate-binding protein YgfZ
VAFITVPQQAAALMPHFDRYIIREDVQLSDTSNSRVYYYFGADPQLPIGKWIAWDLLGRATGGLLEVAAEVAAVIHGADVAADFSKCNKAAFEALRIEAGTPLFGVDFGDNNFPQEVGRDRQAISFTKGCYLGQETVARIDALGHVNQQLVGVRFDGSAVPAVGVELQKDGATVGRVTSATFSPRFGAPLALAMVRREANAVATRLESAAGTAEVVQLSVGAS